VRPSIPYLFYSFLKLGFTAFGGPTMVAYIRELSVNKKKWLDGETFKNGVALCQSIPGATAMQVSGYVGLMKRGLLGAVATFVGFGLSAFLFMLLLSWAYTLFGNITVVSSLFKGLQVIVVGIVANATYTFARETMKVYQDILIALASAIAFWFGISPFFVIAGAALIGMIVFRTQMISMDTKDTKSTGPGQISFVIPIVFTIAGVMFLFAINKRLFELAMLMIKIDLFAFGGGFAALPLMLQEVVNVRGWMDSKTFMDGIALGQVTPGPIVITATFVGFLTNGLAGAVVATMAVFIPSFILLVIGASIFDRLKQSLLFQRSVKGIFASFVGLLLYVTIKFAIAVPWDFIRLMIVVAAIVALLKKIDILYIVLAGALISIFLL